MSIKEFAHAAGMASCFSLILAGVAHLGSCVTPLILRDDAIGLGLYRIETPHDCEITDHRRVSGVGVLWTCGRLIAGYSKTDRISIRTGKGKCSYSNDCLHLAVGESSIVAALELMDGAQPLEASIGCEATE